MQISRGVSKGGDQALPKYATNVCVKVKVYNFFNLTYGKKLVLGTCFKQVY